VAVAGRLRAAEAELAVPDGLWERITDPARPAPAYTGRGLRTEPRRRLGRSGRRTVRARRTVPVTARRPVRALVVAVAAAAVAFVALGAWWLASPASRPWHTQRPPAAPPVHPAAIPLRVHNSETACRSLHTLECALRLAKNPYERYAADDNTAGRVWHGDRVLASCVVTDGRLLRDEQGVTSRRWYRVRTPDGTRGWLPGVRTRNSAEVPLCTSAERPRAPRTPRG